MPTQEELDYVERIVSGLDRTLLPKDVHTMVCSYAEKDGFALTMGLYTHGWHAPAVDEVCGITPTDLCGAGYDRDTPVPEEYAECYDYHSMVCSELCHYAADRTCKEVKEGGSYKPLEDVMLGYADVLGHVNDESLMELVFTFCDIVDNIVLKEVILCDRCPACRDALWKDVQTAYCSDAHSLWPLVTPYLQTLKGMDAQSERVRYLGEYEKGKGLLGMTLARITSKARSMGLYASLDELESELEASCCALPEDAIDAIGTCLREEDE